MLIKNRRWLCDLDTMDFDPGGAKKYAPRDRLMRHQARDGCVKSPFKRIQSAWTQQCHIEGDSVDTIGALRPMGGIWASNNKSRASITLIIKFRDSPERGGHFEESPTEILHINSSDSPNADAPILPTAPWSTGTEPGSRGLGSRITLGLVCPFKYPYYN